MQVYCVFYIFVDFQEQDKTPDIFIVHHQNYHAVREAVGKTILTSKIDDLNDVITVSNCMELVRATRNQTRNLTVIFSFSLEKGCT